MPFRIASSISRVKQPLISKKTSRSSWVLVTIISESVASAALAGEKGGSKRQNRRSSATGGGKGRRNVDMIRYHSARSL
jgi:hypothetical protein